jgi:HupE / UreJ protein
VRPLVPLLLGLLFLLPSTAGAHDIPSSITVQAFIHADAAAGVLRVLVRVPLAAMRDVDFPMTAAGFLDLTRAAPLVGGAARVWIADEMPAFENGAPLPAPRVAATRIVLPSDRSFVAYDTALAQVRGAPLPEATQIVWNQAMIDVLLEYPIHSAQDRFAIDPELARLAVHTTTVLRFITTNGAERDFEWIGDPGLVRLEPSWRQASGRFIALGMQHILSGIDHLLFIICLVIPFRKLRPLLAIVTAFTVAHSITLIASAAGFAPDALWFPPLIEVLIALSIVYMALENIVGAKLERRWMAAFGFGLVHGFGFSFALRNALQFAGTHLAVSLFSFNLGVELGQLVVLAATVPVLTWLFRRVMQERMGTIILSAFVAHTAWHWMLDRWAVLSQYRVTLPALDAAFAASAMRAAMLMLVIGAAAWGMYELYTRLTRGPRALAGTGSDT